jgi:hypothetical protein
MGMDPKRNRAVESHLSKGAKGGAPGVAQLSSARMNEVCAALGFSLECDSN